MAKLYATDVTENSFVVDISGLQEASERYSNAIYMVYRIIDGTTLKLIGTRSVADGSQGWAITVSDLLIGDGIVCKASIWFNDPVDPPARYNITPVKVVMKFKWDTEKIKGNKALITASEWNGMGMNISHLSNDYTLSLAETGNNISASDYNAFVQCLRKSIFDTYRFS